MRYLLSFLVCLGMPMLAGRALAQCTTCGGGLQGCNVH